MDFVRRPRLKSVNVLGDARACFWRVDLVVGASKNSIVRQILVNRLGLIAHSPP